MLEEISARTVRGVPRAPARKDWRASRTYGWRVACTLAAASAGMALFNAGGRRPAPATCAQTASIVSAVASDVQIAPTPVLFTRSKVLPRQDASSLGMSQGVEDDQPAGVCWLAKLGGAPPACICSAGTIETQLTPDYMRTLLAAWHDTGSLGTGELNERLREVDVACDRREGAQ